MTGHRAQAAGQLRQAASRASGLRVCPGVGLAQGALPCGQKMPTEQRSCTCVHSRRGQDALSSPGRAPECPMSHQPLPTLVPGGAWSEAPKPGL